MQNVKKSNKKFNRQATIVAIWLGASSEANCEYPIDPTNYDSGYSVRSK